MINNIELLNFKCFEKTKLNLNNATLLLGANSGGKSSIIQALLLCDSLKSCETRDSIDLISNKHGLFLHSFGELLNENSSEDYFQINISQDNVVMNFRFNSSDDPNVTNVTIPKQNDTVNKSTPKIVYLGANRKINIEQTVGNIKDIKLGRNNEYIGYIIERGQKNLLKISSSRNHWDHNNTKLLDIQINDWLNYILPGNRVAAEMTGDDGHVSLLFGNKKTLHFNNVGFGVAYVLPIIVAGLIGEEKSILIIENPELHLHPKAQSYLAMFLAHISACGVQIIIETHSEHILNGFRKAMLDKNNLLEDNDLSVYYFDLEYNKTADKIEINNLAEIKSWPNGFMDQEEIDLFELRRLRKNG